MSRTQAREVYGFGAGVRTRDNRASVWARRVIGAAILGTVAALVVGCSPVSDAKAEAAISVQTAGWLNVETDDATGCQYLGKRNSSAGITPRIAADGKAHMGCKGTAP